MSVLNASESPTLLMSDLETSLRPPPKDGIVSAGVPREQFMSSDADARRTTRSSDKHFVDSRAKILSPLKAKRASYRGDPVDEKSSMTSASRVTRDRMYSVAPASAKSLLDALMNETECGDDDAKTQVKDDDEDPSKIDDVEESERIERMLNAADAAREWIQKRGLRLWKDASNYDRNKGRLLHVGSVKACASLKKYPGILCLFKKGTISSDLYSMEALSKEIEMSRTIASFGVRVALPLTDPFEFKVDGTSTFGFLAEKIYTSMSEPYKPQAHKSTWCAMGASLRSLSATELSRAQKSAQVIGIFNKFNHYLHDMQLLLQNGSPDERQNGFIYVIDPGDLFPVRKKSGNQTYRLQKFIRKLLGK